jgi:hypothetical protein
VDIKVEIQSNSEFQSLTLSPTRSSEPSRLQIKIHEVYQIGFGLSTYARKEDERNFPMELVPSPTRIGFDKNCQNNVNIQSPTHSEVVHIKTDVQIAYDIQLGCS